MKTKILDCTIRDGGHLNDWRFDSACAKAAYYAALKSGVDYFEAGYRYPPGERARGAFAHTSDALLAELFAPSDRCKLTVMVDAGKCESTQFEPCRPEKTPLRAVRVAAYPFELEKAMRMVEEVHDKGYEVFLNLMASAELGEENYAQLGAWKKKELLAGVYFADSFGSFIPGDIPMQMAKLRASGFERIGFHPHNNLQLAFANTLRAIEEGAACVDASILGMGRGAGNLPIEILLGYLERCGDEGYNTVPYLDAIDRHFLALYREIDWGYGLAGLMSGLANIHPYYAENLFKNNLYTVDEIWNALRIIKERCPISFSIDKLGETMGGRFFTPLTPQRTEAVHRALIHELSAIPAADAAPASTFPLAGAYKGRKFLVIATGPSTKTHAREISALAKREECVTIGVNRQCAGFEPDFHVFVSRKRFEQYAAHVSPRSTLLVPSFFGRSFVEARTTRPAHFFDVSAPCRIEDPPVDERGQHCLGLNVSVSAILLAQVMGAATIYAVGMDGYADEWNKKMVYFYNEDSAIDDKETANYRYDQLAKELARVNGFLQGRSIPFFIVTPTSHRKYYRPLKNVVLS